MGVSVLYRAMPPKSPLYRRLQQEKAFYTLMVNLFPYGCGIFQFFEIDSNEVEEILKYLIDKYQDTLGSESGARRWINEFQCELESTRNLYPGVEDRTASLEKSSGEIKERLIQELNTKQGGDAAEVIDKLMFGDQILASHFFSAGEDSLGLVSLPLVQEGAKILQKINPHTLRTKDGNWNEWGLNHFQQWRELYLVAAEQQEEILVGVY